MYTHTERRTVNGERVEQIMQLSTREYLVCMKDVTVYCCSAIVVVAIVVVIVVTIVNVVVVVVIVVVLVDHA